MVFQAVSKALLFLCVGSIEQHIGSRDIEEMRGLFAEMPKTAIIISLGVLIMILPPFGMLLGKWMAIESAANNLFVISMLALGSTVTVVYWARWAGVLLGSHYTGESKPEKTAPFTMGPLSVLLSCAVLLSLAAPLIYLALIVPGMEEGAALPYSVLSGIFTGSGSFAVIPLFAITIAFGLLYWRLSSKTKPTISEGYMSGIQGDRTGTYVGPMNKTVKLTFSNFYLESIFGESKLTPWLNRIAVGLIMLMIGGAL